MSQKRPPTWGNPDHRRQTQLPAPPIAQIEQQLFSLLNPGSFKPLRLAFRGEETARPSPHLTRNDGSRSQSGLSSDSRSK